MTGDSEPEDGQNSEEADGRIPGLSDFVESTIGRALDLPHEMGGDKRG